MNPKRRVSARAQTQGQALILALMEKAVLRACKGVKPSPEDLRQHAQLFDNPRTGQMQLWWLGETVLLLTPAADGFRWQFMGSAAEPAPAIKIVGA